MKILFYILIVLNISNVFALSKTQEGFQKLIEQAPEKNVIVISKVNSFETKLYLEKSEDFIKSTRGISRYQSKVSFIPLWTINMRNMEKILATQEQKEFHERAIKNRRVLKDWLNKLLVDELSSILNVSIRWIDNVAIVPSVVKDEDKAWLNELSKAYDFQIYIQK